jgi:uncharacterized membrane protein YeaQ/YmgE (transglycosylase-associated protein family)
MTSETFAAAIVVGVLIGAVFNVVMKKGGHGLFGDLALGLVGSTVAVLICELIGLAPDAGTVGMIGAALAGSAVVIVVQRKVWSAPPARGAQ